MQATITDRKRASGTDTILLLDDSVYRLTRLMISNIRATTGTVQFPQLAALCNCRSDSVRKHHYQHNSLYCTRCVMMNVGIY